MSERNILPCSTAPLSSESQSDSELDVVYLKGTLDVRAPNLNDTRSEGPSPDHTKELQQAIIQFLDRCNIPFHVIPYDRQLHDTCVGEAVRRGYPLDTPNKRGHTLRTFLPQGITISVTAYMHLKDEATRIYIALYTSLLIYTDDVFRDDVEIVKEFNERFIQRQPQGDPVLDSLAEILCETSQHFGLAVSNIIVTAALNLVTALSWENEALGTNLSPRAHEFPPYMRIMSGAGDAFALFAFPSEMPLHWYMHGIANIRDFINNGNDVLSFYKEELAGDSVNHISTLAQCRQISKIESLRCIADSVVDSHTRLLEILAPQPAALEAYLHFSRGYTWFHTSLKRYRLGELYDY